MDGEEGELLIEGPPGLTAELLLASDATVGCM